MKLHRRFQDVFKRDLEKKETNICRDGREGLIPAVSNDTIFEYINKSAMAYWVIIFHDGQKMRTSLGNPTSQSVSLGSRRYSERSIKTCLPDVSRSGPHTYACVVSTTISRISRGNGITRRGISLMLRCSLAAYASDNLSCCSKSGHLVTYSLFIRWTCWKIQSAEGGRVECEGTWQTEQARERNRRPTTQEETSW